MSKKKDMLRKEMILIVDLIEQVKSLEEKIVKLEKKCEEMTVAKPAAKSTTTKKEVKKAKKEAKKLSKEEEAKREAKRLALQKKAEKAAEGKKITSADLKKLNLQDIYGVGPKIEAYYIANGISDMVKLSNRNPDTLPKKLIEGLPALKSYTFEMKEEKIESNIEEAKFMIELLMESKKD